MGRDPLRPYQWFRWRSNGGEEWFIGRESMLIVPPEWIESNCNCRWENGAWAETH